VHELIIVQAYFLFLDRILVSSVPSATVRTFKPKRLKKPKSLKTFFKTLGFYQFWDR